MNTFSGMGIDQEMLNSGSPLNLGGLEGVQDLINNMSVDNRDDISAMFGKELSGVIDFDLWLKIVNLQKAFNDKVAPGWQQDIEHKKYDYWMAVLDETAEVLGSRHWKWWKDSSALGEIDWDNVQVELIDIFHFMLSISIQINHQDTIFMSLMSIEKSNNDNHLPPERAPDFFNKFWNEFMMAVWQKSLPLLVVKWTEYWYKSGGDFNTLARDYFIKNALNDIRQEFGYATGGYQKMWRSVSDPSKLVEDNEVAGNLLKTKEITENLTVDSIKDMKDILRRYYLEYVTV